MARVELGPYRHSKLPYTKSSLQQLKVEVPEEDTFLSEVSHSSDHGVLSTPVRKGRVKVQDDHRFNVSRKSVLPQQGTFLRDVSPGKCFAERVSTVQSARDQIGTIPSLQLEEVPPLRKTSSKFVSLGRQMPTTSRLTIPRSST